MRKLFLIFLVLNIALIALCEDLNPAEESKKKAEEYIKACVDETGIPEETANKIKAGDFSVRDEKAQCFTNCFFKQAGFLNEKGEPQADVMVKKLSHNPSETNEALVELVNKCIKEKGETDCETSFKIYECYRSGASYGASQLM